MNCSSAIRVFARERTPLVEKQIDTWNFENMATKRTSRIKLKKKKKADAFVLDFGDADNGEQKNSPKKKSSLQAAFEKFRKTRQDEFRQKELIRARELLGKKDHERMWALRMKFLEQCKQYFGVPYAKRYQTPGTPEYDAPLFLDCCGLVRRVLLDLKEDFGFKVDSWNQAYQYDTLPITITEEEMKPGDLVFISGTYFNKKSKKQKHDMVHVEVWLGDGPKTIGARWQKGKVQVFDSYRFISKSYHSMVYHFKSIDTWLQGICKSYCDEHPWTRSKFKPGKKSIFSLQSKHREEQEEEFQEAADASDADEEEEPTEAETEEMEREKEEGAMDDIAEEQQVSDATKNGMELDAAEKGQVRLKTEIRNDQEETLEEAMVMLRMETGEPSESCHGNKEAMEDDLTSLDDEFPPELEREESLDKHDEHGGNRENGLLDDKLGHEGSYYRTNAQIEDGFHEDVRQRDAKLQPPASTDTKTINEPSEFSITSHNPNSNNNNSNGDTDWGCYDNNPNSKEGDGGKGGTTSCSSREAGGSGSGENGSKTGKDSSGSKEKKDRKSGDGGRGGGGGGGGRDRKSPGEISGRKSVMQLDTSPTFYIGGNNGVSLIEGALLAKGWRRVMEKHSDQFRLKWVELRSSINYNTFKPGEQLVNRIPNSGGILGTKTGLFNTLREYERVCERTRGGRAKSGLRLEEFFPESFILDLKPDRDAFFETFKEGEIWISKPNGMNQGKGIYLVREITQLQERYRQREEEAASSKAMQRRTRGQAASQRLIQRYIPNPLLLNNKKFDVRAYMLIACTNPFIVLFHNGYLRLSCEDYDPESSDITTHLTNQFQQRKNPNYQDIKEDTVWSMDAFNDHVNQHLAEDKGLPKDWVKGFFQKRMCQIMSQCFLASKNKLETTLGYFDLLGFDFLLDTDMKIWLLEINVNPALHTNCEVLKELLPGVVEETLDIVIEIQEKIKRKQPIMPLSKRRRYQLLYDETSGGSVPSMRPPTRKSMSSATPANEVTTTSRSARTSDSSQRVITKARSPRQIATSPRQVATSPRQVATSPRQVATSPRQVATSPKQTVMTSPRLSVTSPRQSSAIPPPVKMPSNRAPPVLHGRQLPVVKLTLRKNVTPLAPPIVKMHQEGAIPEKNATDVKEATSKVNSIKL